MPSKQWRIAPRPPDDFAESIGLPDLHAHLLYNRGVRTREQARSFLRIDPGLEHDPRLVPNMDAAVERLERAVSDGEKIGVYGDFDVDGITGTAIIGLGLRELGAEIVSYIPERATEGHGLNEGAVRALRDQGVGVLVTVDCGVTDVEQVALASSLGVDTVITDHHTPEEAIPAAHAVVHAGLPDSRYPFGHLTGAGMAYKLVCAVWDARGRERPVHLLELAALGTVADVGRMEGENRYFVSRGLALLNRTANTGLRALMKSARITPGGLDEEDMSFALIPRLNAPGRIGRAETSLSLLTTSSANEAEQLAAELEYLNRERQELTRSSMELASPQLRFPDGLPAVIVVRHREWQPGVIGLIAGRLSDQYSRPAVAIAIGDEVSRGSARSVQALNVLEALRSREDLLIQFGGHPLAAGFSAKTEDLESIDAGLNDYASGRLDLASLTPSIDIDCELAPSSLDGENLRFLKRLAPYGLGNPRPTFLARGAGVVESRLVGKDGHHLKLRLYDNTDLHEAIAFRMGERLGEAEGKIDVVFTSSVDEWRGRRRHQLIVQDFARSA